MAWLFVTSFLLSYSGPYCPAATRNKESPETAARALPAGTRQSPETSVRVVKIFELLNDPKRYKTGGNLALEFERKYWNYGAASEQQQKEKEGHIFLFLWKSRKPLTDVIARFEYRQIGSRDEIFVQELKYPEAHGTIRSTFFVTGRAYENYGPVSAWRFSIVRSGSVLAQKRSFIW